MENGFVPHPNTWRSSKNSSVSVLILDAAKLGRAVEIAHAVEANCSHGKISIGAADKDVQQRFFPTGRLGVR